MRAKAAGDQHEETPDEEQVIEDELPPGLLRTCLNRPGHQLNWLASTESPGNVLSAGKRLEKSMEVHP